MKSISLFKGTNCFLRTIIESRGIESYKRLKLKIIKEILKY